MQRTRGWTAVVGDLTWIIALVGLATGPAFGQTDLVTNGNFEAGWVPDGQCDLVEPDADSLPMGWSCYETFSSAMPETSLITLFPGNGPSLPGANAFKVWRGDDCHLSGDWTTIQQDLHADVSACQALTLNIDVMLLPVYGPHSHNLGGSGHVAGPCDPSGYEYPLSVMIDYTDSGGNARCWQYGWYQYPVTQAGRTDAGCVSGFDGQNANPNPAVSMMIPTAQWFPNSFDLHSALPGAATIQNIRVGGSGWTFYGVLDNVQILCSDACAQSPYPACAGPCASGKQCLPDPSTQTCRCQSPPCEQAPFPACAGACQGGEPCVADPDTESCRCESAPCEQSPFPLCGGPCPEGQRCVAQTATGACICEPLPCEGTFPTCNGPCPVGLQCTSTGTSCVCEPLPCEATHPACNGSCPAWQQCTSTGASCVCEPLPCEATYPACNGSCPAGQQCATTGTSCTCEPLPCEEGSFPACNGPCPAGLVCVPDTLTGACRCSQPDGTYYKAEWPDYSPSGMPDFAQNRQGFPPTLCGPTALLNSCWWFDSELECDTHHTTGQHAETEPNGTCDQSNALGESPPIPGTLVGAADLDWYGFDVPKGGDRGCDVTVSTCARSHPGDADTRVSLYGACTGTGPGNLIARSDDDCTFGPQSEVIASLAPGRYFVLVDRIKGAAGPYTLSVGLDCYPLIERWTQTASDDHSEYNVPVSIQALATCANTDDPGTVPPRWLGTRLQDLQTCVDLWLIAKQLQSDYVETTVIAPDFEQVEHEVERSEDVLLLLGFYWPGPTGPVRCGGHYVTVAGVDSTTRTITLGDPALDNAENGAPGRVRGPNHAHPTGHDDAQNMSHDRYATGPSVLNPSVSKWSLQSYATAPGAQPICYQVSQWCSGEYAGQNPPEPSQFQDPCPSPGAPIWVEVEAMIDVSPVQSAVCAYLDSGASWPDNLRMRKGSCQNPVPTEVAYDVIRGKQCGLDLPSLVPHVALGHVQCLYDDTSVDQFADLSPNDDDCFKLWFYLVRRSGDPDYGHGSGGLARLPDSGGCP